MDGVEVQVEGHGQLIRGEGEYMVPSYDALDIDHHAEAEENEPQGNVLHVDDRVGPNGYRAEE